MGDISGKKTLSVEENASGFGKIINNIDVKWNVDETIINTDLHRTFGKANNDIDDEVNLYALAGLSGAINNTESEPAIDGAINNMDPESITCRTNNDIDSEIYMDDVVDAGGLSWSGWTNNYMDLEPTTGAANDDIDDKVDVDIFGGLSRAINDMNVELTIGEANNNTYMGVDIGVSGKPINKTDVKLNVSGLCKANTIVKEEIFESNLF